MKSKTLSFDKGILLNDLKRFYWIGMVYLLGLLFTVPVKILMIYSKPQQYYDRYNRMKMLFYYRSDIEIILTLIIPVLIAIFVFRYMQVKKSCHMIHSLPIKRKQLYQQHVLSGMILFMVPIIITAFVSFLLKMVLHLDAYSTQDILKWVGFTFMMNTIVFLSSVFVAMFTGLSAAQGVFTYIFLMLPLGVITLVCANLGFFVYGSIFSTQINTNAYLCPLVKLTELQNNWKNLSFDISYLEIIIYIIIGLILYFASQKVYEKRNLEAVSQPIVFDQLKGVFKYGVTFCFMLIGGLYFKSTQQSIVWVLIGYIIGSFIGYLLSEIILHKSFKVLKYLKGYVPYVLVIVILLLGLHFDLIGYEKSTPTMADIDGIRFSESYSDIQYSNALPYSNGKNKYRFYYTEKNNLKNIVSLHDQIVKSGRKDKYNFNKKDDLYFTYKLKNGKEVERAYNISYTDYSKYLKPIYESQEYKNMKYPVLDIDPSNVKELKFIARGKLSVAIVTDPLEIKEALNILKQEINDQTYEQITDNRPIWSGIELIFSEDLQTIDEKDHHINMVSGGFRKNYLKLEKWLSEKNYLKDAILTPEDISRVELFKPQKGLTIYHTLSKMESGDTNIKKVTVYDKNQLNVCLRNYVDDFNYDSTYPYGIAIYDKKGERRESGGFTKESIPDFIKKQLN